MRNLTRIALLGATLMSTLLVSCKREMVAPENPTFDAETNTVKTKIFLDISTSKGKDTKITSTYAQENDNFLGMSAVHLLSYELTTSPTPADSGFFFFKTGAPATRDYDLGDLFEPSSVTAGHTSRSVELALPLGTNCVVLYGKATKTASDEVQGKTYASGDPTDLNTLAFTLNPRLESKNTFAGATKAFSTILNSLLVAGLVKENNTYSTTDPEEITEEAYWRVYTSTGYFPTPTGQTDRRFRFWWPKTGTIASDEEVPDPLIQKDDLSLYNDGEELVYNQRTWIMHTGSLSWKDVGLMYQYENDQDNETSAGDITAIPFNALAESLGEAYTRLTNVKSQKKDPNDPESITLKELRAGSAGAILRTCKDLYAIAYKSANTKATSWYEEVARLLAAEIVRRMQLFFTYSGNNITGWDDIGIIKTRLQESMSSTDWAEHSSNIGLLTDKYLSDATGAGGFPINLNLPVGAAVLTCSHATKKDAFDQFAYTEDIPAYGMANPTTGEDITFSVYNYRYPAELMYYGNTPLFVSDNVVTSETFPSAVVDNNNVQDKWSWNSSWTGWSKNGAVSSTTRTVAMRKCINYGTALLASHVRYETSSMTLKDNRKAIYGEDDNEIAVGPSIEAGFKVTGIIVGGQPETVCWDFTRKPVSGGDNYAYDTQNKKFTGLVFDDGTGKTHEGWADDDEEWMHVNQFDKMVYDKVSPAFRIGDNSVENSIYTLCWDNYDATLAADAQSDVFVALELVNNTGKDFWGELNMVRNGGTFYLVGKLDLAALKQNAQTDDTYSKMLSNLSRSDYFYPPFNPVTGATINAPRVLMQDYKTVANLIIGQDALKHAYVTVPDLRASQVSLGVSIDLQWEPGLSFDVQMGNL